MDGADAGAGQHGGGGFRNHRQIDGDAVAFLDAVRLHHIGGAAHHFVQFAIGDVLGIGRLVAFPDEGCLIFLGGQMPVETIVCDIQHAIIEPADAEVGGIVGNVLDLRVGREPVEAFALLGPEGLRIFDGGSVHVLVALRVHIRALGPFFRNGEDMLVHLFPPNLVRAL
jgi:hypothetical protein